MYQEIIKYIEAYDRIIIFRHIDGDGDALGSQWALYYYLTERYPQKEIYAVGDETPGYKDVFPKAHLLEDDMFDGSLAVIVDTANKERVSDQRYEMCKQIIKIDHHLPVDDYGTISFVDETRSSCAEIVTEILFELEEGKALSQDVANNLYKGIISDTQGFSISSVSAKTFKAASYLMESHISPSDLSQSLRQMDLEIFKFQSFVMGNIEYRNNQLAYLYITQEQLKEAQLEVSQVKFFVNIMKGIRGIKVWALFIEQADQTYSASLRSHNTDINVVAREFHGGGHLFASGVKNLSKEDTESMINKLLEQIK